MNTLKTVYTFAFFVLLSISSFAKEYYVNAETGSDKNNGTSPATAWKSLKKVSDKNFKPGDQILLATGQIFFGSIQWNNQYGKKSKPIIISSYTVGNSNVKPIIDAQNHLNGIKLENCSFITINGLSIRADGGNNNPKRGMRCGILYTTNTGGSYNDISIKNCTVKDVFFENENFERGKDEVKTANGTQSYGWGIRFLLSKNSKLKNVLIESNEIENVSHTGIKMKGNIDQLRIFGNKIFKTGGPGMQFSGITNGHIKGNDINYSGSKDDTRKWGRGSGMWTWGCDSILIEHNSFRNANGPADSAGCHIDFNCKNIVVQYNLSENNAGGFAEILGNNWNCAYRYNVSINDGHRIKKKGVAFQEGKIFWLSGFVGKDRQRHGPYNSYFYNNTIYVKSDIIAKMAVSKVAEGVLITNNIFYIEGDSKAVLGDQYKPQEAGEADIPNVIFQNNLFLKASNWPKSVLIQDEAPVFGNPGFFNPGGSKITDYTPINVNLIKNKGIDIPMVPGDKKGLIYGLKVEKDILGNEINGKPDMGAIEVN
ncbi:right-handed parallel beta-helix repeat-containing protein [Lutimonas saemankumensis]|uniref:right-handed parallel beta-helix repeat-containing protein n=1 Tax=Lutimonas saemankumensis TaxID=483016 RepID=UPI001CD6A11A|nr:right-handed parallel beta-helix repeat-containing protein [Lutimonas saemankumensis]MCA0932482.1 right-handed parallel beta-helix repeat-containing protein [Lutimonas saemankumensis]